MNNIQINGQRRWGPPDDWTGPPPVHGTEIFIKNLPEEVFELELYTIFSRVGIVYEVRLPINWNGFNRGYAFLRFTSVHYADRAIHSLDGFEIRKNRMIKVTRSIDNTRLFLSAVPIDKNAEDIKNDLLQHVENVKKVYVYPTLENRSVFRGYAFIEFETHRDAAIAKRILTPDICHAIFEKKCVAAWANPLPFIDQSILKSLHVLFLRNIPKEIKGFKLKKIVESLIGDDEIKHIKRLNDFAFLTFKDHKSAERALYSLQNVPFLVPEHETQVEWAIPRELADSSFSTVDREFDKGNDSQNRLTMLKNGVHDNSNTPYSDDLPLFFSNFNDLPKNSEIHNYKQRILKSNKSSTVLPFQSDNSISKNYITHRGLARKECDVRNPSDHHRDARRVKTESLRTVAEDKYFGSGHNRGLLPDKNWDKYAQARLRGTDCENIKSHPVPLPRYKKSVERTENSPFALNYSPDSEFGSKGSEDSLNNYFCHFSNSPLPSPSPSASTSRSSDSPGKIFCSDDRHSSIQFDDVFIKKENQIFSILDDLTEEQNDNSNYFEIRDWNPTFPHFG